MAKKEKASAVRRWISALKSGKYNQAQHGLRSSTGFCCLGVACDLYDPAGWKKKSNSHAFTYKGRVGFIPESVARYFGIHGTDQSVLANMNDSGVPFNKIALHIEAKYLHPASPAPRNQTGKKR
jgi:hypothetical protein